MERGSGIKFVTSTSQNDSNKMNLTSEGEQLLKKFREFSKGFDAEVTEKFNKSFKE
jgi:predicted transcriptional regulator